MQIGDPNALFQTFCAIQELSEPECYRDRVPLDVASSSERTPSNTSCT